MYRPSSKLIIALCGFILGLNFLVIWLIDSRLPYAQVLASRTDVASVILPTVEPPLQKVEKCEPVVDNARIEEQRAVIATLEGEVARLKVAPADDGHPATPIGDGVLVERPPEAVAGIGGLALAERGVGQGEAGARSPEQQTGRDRHRDGA